MSIQTKISMLDLWDDISASWDWKDSLPSFQPFLINDGNEWEFGWVNVFLKLVASWDIYSQILFTKILSKA